MGKTRLPVRAAALVLAVFGVTDATGRSQPSSVSARSVVQERTVPPLQRGVIPIEARAPASAERHWRRFVRRQSVSLARVGTSRATYAPGRVIVKFRDSTSIQMRTAAVSRIDPAARARLASARPSHANFDVIEIAQTEDAEAVARTLTQNADVEYAQAAYRVEPRLVPNDRFYSRQWNLPLINLERAWDIQPDAGSSIVVAVLDTGIAYTNATVGVYAYGFELEDGSVYPALGGLTLQFVAATELGTSERFVAPFDFIWNDATPVDMDGHGTHVCGTIGQLTNNGATGTGDVANRGGTAGVAFNVKVMPVKVLDGPWDVIFGAPNQATDDVVARGIRYAADQGAHVVNMSLGRTGPPSPVVEDAIRYAVARGVFVVIAGGNGFEEGNETEVLAEIANRIAGAVSVAAVNRSKGHAHYSTTGTWIEVAAPGGAFEDFGTEGGILQQTLDLDLVDRFLLPPAQYAAPRFDALAYYYFVGTSQAAPHVSGVAAMLIQQGITSPGAVEAALERFAVDLGAPGRDSIFGFGLIDARTTLRGLGGAR